MTDAQGPKRPNPDAARIPTCRACHVPLTWDLDHWAHTIDGELVIACPPATSTGSDTTP